MSRIKSQHQAKSSKSSVDTQKPQQEKVESKKEDPLQQEPSKEEEAGQEEKRTKSSEKVQKARTLLLRKQLEENR